MSKIQENLEHIIEWQWRRPELLDEYPPVNIIQIGDRPGERGYVLATEGEARRIAFAGFLLLVLDGLIPVEFRLPLWGSLWLYMASDRFGERRRPLKGWKNVHDEEDSLAWAVRTRLSMDGGETQMRKQRIKGKGASFRRTLGRLLRKGKEAAPTSDRVPVGVASQFALPPWNKALDLAGEGIFERVGASVNHAVLKTDVPDVDGILRKKLQSAFSHPDRSPVKASREALVWAVAHSTFFATAACYDYAMRDFAKQLEPALDEWELQKFRVAHLTTPFLGIPFLCLPQGCRDLVGELALDVLHGRISEPCAGMEAKRVLGVHGLLVEEGMAEDRARKRRHQRIDHVLAREVSPIVRQDEL